MKHSAAQKSSSRGLANLPNAKNQHYVWRHYLDAWTVRGTFWCYRHKDTRLFQTTPKSVANENYFYKAHKLTPGDVAFLEAVINQGSDERLREINRNFIQYSQATFRMRDWLRDTNLGDHQRNEIEQAGLHPVRLTAS